MLKESEYTKNDYSIGVVTYMNRYNSYFKPNIKNLKKYFPDKQIICIINGHPDKPKNILYLKEVTEWLTFEKIQYVTFENHQSLAKCWNWILLMSSSQSNLFLNDDILIKKNFREDFESSIKLSHFFTINKSFSHFYLNKQVIEKVGWFDERFLGIGEEDGDFLIRMSIKNIPLENKQCKDIINYIAPGKNPSFQEISKSRGKYSQINRDFMDKKWYFNHLTDDKFEPDTKFDWNGQEFIAKQREGMGTPSFYPHELLKTHIQSKNNKYDLKEKTLKANRSIKNFIKNKLIK